MKKIITSLAACYITALLVIAPYVTLTRAEAEINTSRQVLTLRNIDLSKEGTISWDVSAENWKYRAGEARLSLEIDRTGATPAHMRDGSKLRLKISAQGKLQDGTANNRLIRDWYYTTDEPFTGNPKLWESGDAATTQYGLAGLDIRPYEALTIRLQILSPYPELQRANPRLHLAPSHDYAIDEHFPAFRLAMWSISGLGVVATFVLFLQAWRKAA